MSAARRVVVGVLLALICLLGVLVLRGGGDVAPPRTKPASAADSVRPGGSEHVDRGRVDGDAPQEPSSSEPPNGPDEVRLTGVVRDEHTGAPVGGVRIVARRSTPARAPASAALTAITSEDGRFDVPVGEVGSFDLVASKEGYAPFEVLHAPDGCELTLDVQRESVLEVIVTDAEGRRVGMGTAQIAAVGPSWRAFPRPRRAEFSTAGEAVWRGVLPGRYLLRVTPDPGTGLAQTALTVDLSPGAHESVTVSCDAGVMIRGTVVSTGDGRAIVGAAVHMAVMAECSTITDDAGGFVLGPVREMPRYGILTIDAPGFARRVSTGFVNGSVVELDTGRELLIRVLDPSGAPYAAAQLRVFELFRQIDEPALVATTDSNGEFVLRTSASPASGYLVIARAPDDRQQAATTFWVPIGDELYPRLEMRLAIPTGGVRVRIAAPREQPCRLVLGLVDRLHRERLPPGMLVPLRASCPPDLRREADLWPGNKEVVWHDLLPGRYAVELIDAAARRTVWEIDVTSGAVSDLEIDPDESGEVPK